MAKLHGQSWVWVESLLGFNREQESKWEWEQEKEYIAGAQLLTLPTDVAAAAAAVHELLYQLGSLAY